MSDSHNENDQQINAAKKNWSNVGYGPAPHDGGVWFSNDVLTPPGGVSGTVSSIKYSYDKTNWGNWTNKISVKLVITNSTGQQLKEYDVTSSANHTINTSGDNIPADCKLTLKMKVGDLPIPLNNPPSISQYRCTVYY